MYGQGSGDQVCVYLIGYRRRKEDGLRRVDLGEARHDDMGAFRGKAERESPIRALLIAHND